MSIKKGILITAILSLIISAWAGMSLALKAPHDKSKSIQCSSCHYSGGNVRGYKPLCTANCHNSTSGNSSRKKAMDTQFVADPFGTFTINDAVRKPRSHAYATLPNYSAAGVNNKRAGTNKYISVNQTRVKVVSGTNTIVCSKCHYAHGSDSASFARNPFLRASSKGDEICFQCHEERRVGAGSARSAPVAGKAYSHPVEVNYSTIRAAKADFYETNPTNTYGLPSAVLPLYTTYGDVKGAVICSTCHGPLHSADSNPYTLDNISSFSMGNFSGTQSDGMLLRRYNPKTDSTNNMCLACHKVKTHQGKKCADCHEPHKRQGDNNLYLIRKIINTPYGNHSVFFTSTTQMAKRYGVYSGGVGNFKVRSTAICQVCHSSNSKKRHYAYSTAGGDLDHRYIGSGKFEACMPCHPHNAASGGFAAEGCGGCHEGPPADGFGKHSKHTNSASRHDWATGDAVDARSTSSYGFACSRCHVKWNPYTGVRHYASDFNDDVVKNYTAEVDFKYVATLPKQDTTKATYTYGTTGSYDPGTNDPGSKFRAPSAGTCNNLYCHGQFYNGYTGANPTWMGTAACGTCHGAAQELGKGVPGAMRNGGVTYGAHTRHVGGSSQQYGAGTPNFRCNACHVSSATQNSISSVGLDRVRHVNGRINVKFDAAYDSGNATYNGMNTYTTQVNTTITKPAYKTCGLTYCHSDGSRMSNFSTPKQTLGIAYPNWSSTKNFTTTVSGYKSRCARCHGNSTFKGITASMPGVTTKANSHEKHIRNGATCYDCHSQTVGSDSRSIASTVLHVNKAWDVSMYSRYGGTYNSGTKTCDNVKCHGTRRTAAWGTTGKCQDCHYRNTAETSADEGYKDSYAWKNMTSTSSVPKIYSSEWTKFGHGRSTGTYPSSGNVPANKGCTYGEGGCHKASDNTSHKNAIQTPANVYRLYTSPANVDFVCKECHSTGGARSGEAAVKVLGHTAADMAGWGDAAWQFTPKCIDCHDAHGDKNRYMVHKYLNYSGSDSTGKRTYDLSQASGLMNFSTVGGGLMNWSSYVNNSFTGICQRCHNTQANMDHFNKNTYNTGHNPTNSCTGCHKHDAGFKGMDCDGCHYDPPTLSGKHAFHIATTVDSSYVAYDLKNTKTKYAYGCGKCHNSGAHYAGTSGNYTTEVVFDGSNTFPKNATGNYVFGAKSSIDQGADGAGGYSWISTKGTCQNSYCHGEFAGGNTSNDPLWYGTSVCGNCHGASQASAPTGGAHSKHVATLGYDCRNCHDDTVNAGVTNPALKDKTQHVDGKTQWKLYTAWSARIGGTATYYGTRFGGVTTEISSPSYGYCKNTYCHSDGTDTSNPYSALPNYTAKWAESGLTGDKKCGYCHGNKVYHGITAAMPKQTGQAHEIHVVTNNFTKCYICHANVVDSNNNVISTTNHVNQFKNISIITKYKTGLTGYSSTVAAKKTCKNVKCHGGRLTQLWTITIGTGKCSDCHYSTSDTVDYTFKNYTDSSSVAKIYSTQWVDKGHGRTTAYPQSGNPAASKTCTNCHNTNVKHNVASNPFRLYTADPDALCAACHGTGSGQLGKWSQTFGVRTGLTPHTQALVNDGGTQGNATWDFGQHFSTDQKKVKCVDCHDAHGDKNRYMMGTYVNYTGTNKYGIPAQIPSGTMMTFSTIGTTQWRWSSYVKSDYTFICQRCHSGGDANMTHFSKNDYDTAHNAGTKCSTCHSHKSGFKGGGCYGCHGTQASNGAPPDGPTGWAEDDATASTVGLHTPHGYNPRNRYINGSTGGIYTCDKCHGPETDGRSETSHPASSTDAGMRNMTSTATSVSLRSKLSLGSSGQTSVVDDTCWNTGCHTPRAYTRTWKKPVDCDDCHGTIRLKGSTERGYKLHTTMSHKVHINYTGTANPPTAWGKNYRFACSNCHYNAGTNYSTHYNGFVNVTAMGPVNTVGGQFYTRGRSFKGFTTGNEVTTTTYCTNTYCHGKFTNGTTTTRPSWKKSATTMNCTSCHKAKTARITAWTNGTTMPERHPKHVRTSTYNIACSQCHIRTTNANNTTVYFQYSAHVNGRKETFFGNMSGAFDGASRRCTNNYCHSRGSVQAAPYVAANYTADWDDASAAARTGAGKGCSYCHGNKTYNGITSSMPTQSSQAHVKHSAMGTAGDSFKCYVCHANVVSATGTIVSYTNHVNKFKNISVIKSYKSGATNYNPAGTKKCDNIKCHNSRQTPAWSGTANCQDCHYGSGTEDNWTWQNYSGVTANIYSSEWTKKGHGALGAETQGCLKCHDSAVKHNDGTNPFRLFTSVDSMCDECHGASTRRNKFSLMPGTMNYTGYVNHSQAETGGDAGWNFPNSTTKCVDCHDPHGDRNRKMVHTYINMTGSDSYGRPTSSASAQMMFSTVGGGQINWSSFVNSTDVSKSICRRCHSNEANMGNYNKSLYTANHNNGQKCTNCHKHKEGFAAGGEPTGTDNCNGCHNMSMSTAGGFHHVMQNADGTAFSNKTSYSGTDQTSTTRNCLMCHVRHKEFSPAVTANRKRASNLRKFATATHDNQTGINTDFWPAKRAGKYAASSPVMGPSGKYGVCMSCHDAIQYKNTTLQKEDGSSRTPSFTISLYTSSSHNYQIISGMNNFSDSSSFRANCAKCHRTDYINKSSAQTGEKLGLHDKNRSGLLNATGNTQGLAGSQDLCYKCHSQDQRQTYDRYSTVSMSTTSKLIKTAVVAKTSGHPVGENVGAHKADEYYNVTSATTTTGWNRPGYKAGRHVECTDCHNTHGGNASVTRSAGSTTGNQVSGSQAGTWGVQVIYSSGAWKSGKGGTPRYKKVAQSTYQYELCNKCHSSYAYYTGYPEIPSGGVDMTLAHVVGTTTAYDTIQPGITQSDIAIDFNPFNPAFHPVVRKGRNQPPHTANSNWPAGGTRKYWDGADYDSLPTGSNITSDIKFQGVSGLGWTFVPPWSQKSLMACSDCHQSDNTGLAVGQMGATATRSSGSWVSGYFDVNRTWQQDGTFTADRVSSSDSGYAYISANITAFETDVSWTQGSYPVADGSISKREAVVIGYGTATNKGNRDIVVVVKKSGTAVTPASFTFTAGSGDTRMAGEITAPTDGWSVIDKGADGTQNNTDDYTITINKQDTTGAFYVNYAGIAVTYVAPGDLRGPHGSLSKWLLTDLNKKILFDADQDGNVIKTAGGCTPGTSCDNLNEQIANTRVFCLNCHRADVYWSGAPAKGNYSRANHPVGASNHFTAEGQHDVWGTYCMLCHGGKGSSAMKVTSAANIRAKGGIHGIYGTNTLWGPFVSRPSGSFKVFNRPVGVRLLLGASMAGASDANNVYCYTNSAADGTGGCTSEAGKLLGDSYTANAGNSDPLNYTYTGW